MAAELERLSVRDELTGLYNRRGFMNLAEQQIKIAGRQKAGLSLIFIDVDGLKKVNDTMGHEMGDAMLQEFGKLFAGHFRETDIVARLGGDEFAVLVTDSSDKTQMILERLNEKIRTRNAKPGSKFELDFSAGVAVHDPGKTEGLNELISEADGKMYAQKMAKKKAKEQKV
jgi:diguanylate cyclase (GGDEF)-like protein